MGDIRGLFEKKFTESTDISERGLLWQGMRKFSFFSCLCQLAWIST